MIEKLERIPKIETQYGGPATADEIYDEAQELRDKINEIIEVINKFQQPHQHNFKSTCAEDCCKSCTECGYGWGQSHQSK